MLLHASDVAFVFLAALAVYRLAWLVSFDIGPWQCFDRLRTWAGQRAHQRGPQSVAWQFAEWLRCPYCNGLWFSAVCALIYAHNLLVWLLLTLAIAGAQAVLLNLTLQEAA